MNWNVVGLDAPLNEIARFMARVWGTPASEAVTSAMARLDALLERDPERAGESRGGHERVAIEPPLTVWYEVHAEHRTAVVTRVRYTPGRGPA
jgi:ethanolamine utilization microcompartment shell protein EutL